MATPSLPPSSLVSPLPSLSPIFYPLLAPRPAASKQQLIQKWPGRPPSDVRPSSECLFVGCVCLLARSFPLFLPSPKRANDPASLNRNTASSTGGSGLHPLAYRRKRNRLTPRNESRWDAAAAAAAGFSRGRDGRYPRPQDGQGMADPFVNFGDGLGMWDIPTSPSSFPRFLTVEVRRMRTARAPREACCCNCCRLSAPTTPFR